MKKEFNHYIDITPENKDIIYSIDPLPNILWNRDVETQTKKEIVKFTEEQYSRYQIWLREKNFKAIALQRWGSVVT